MNKSPTPGTKEKVTCYECGANYSIDLAKLSDTTTSFKCLKCGEQVPILRRLVKGKKEESAPVVEEKLQAPPARESASSDIDLYREEAWEHFGEEEGEAGNWLATLADMFSILLIFFILMFAISSVDSKKFANVMQSINKALGGNLAALQPPPPEAPALPPDFDPTVLLENLKHSVQVEKQTFSKLRDHLESFITEQQLQDKFLLMDENDALVLIAQDALMFDSGSAEIKEEVWANLRKIAVILKQLPNEIIVGGHTDDVPIRSGRFSSNWELSVMRATNVIHFLIEQCGIDSTRISAAGYAYFKPRYSLASADRGKNRRIEVLIKKKYSDELVNELIKQN